LRKKKKKKEETSQSIVTPPPSGGGKKGRGETSITGISSLMLKGQGGGEEMGPFPLAIPGRGYSKNIFDGIPKVGSADG